ncbi:MFS transporter [Actinacidiphila sp. bgisy160]|uniref:MFS transporter n=1 Tax=Actinacidiphila sp. bgisy160 TaxID=3413796 RepID=UPI003D73FB41
MPGAAARARPAGPQARVPESQVRFRRPPDPTVIRDDIAVQRYAISRHHPQRRVVERIAIAGVPPPEPRSIPVRNSRLPGAIVTDNDVVPVRTADPSPAAPHSRRRAWIVTGLLVVFMMINFADKSVMGLAADSIRRDLYLSATSFGLANGAFFLLFSVCGAAIGLLADRVRPRWLLLGMALLWSVAQLPMALGGGVAVLVASRILLGAAEGPAFPVAQHSALSWFPDRKRNLPGSLITVGTTLGVVVAAPGLTWVIHQHGWRSAFGVVAAVGVVWAAIWVVLGRDGGHAADTPAHAGTEDGGPSPAPDAPYLRILRTGSWIGSTVAFFSTYWLTALALVWVPSYLRDGLGYSDTTAANLVAGLWAVNGVAMLGQAGLTGWLLRRGVSSRWARARVGGITLIACALCCLGLSQLAGGAFAVVLLLAGFGLPGLMVSVAVTSVAELVPGRRRGGALGLMTAVVTTAGLVAPVLTGHLVDTQGPAGYRHAVLLVGALLLLGGTAAVTLIDPARDARRLAA